YREYIYEEIHTKSAHIDVTARYFMTGIAVQLFLNLLVDKANAFLFHVYPTVRRQ
ncbi:hypothetical protein J6590_070058, partial [Homalodisca vitripennis]